MNSDAGSALDKISQHNDDVRKMLQESEQASRQLATKMVILEEDDEEEEGRDEAMSEPIHLGNDRHPDVSLQ